MKADMLHLGRARRVWTGSEPDPTAARLFRRTFELQRLPSRAVFYGFAESRYHLWVNGRYVGRGPTHHHPDEAPADAYDVAPMLRLGRNVVAASVYAYRMATHYAVPCRAPGLTAALVIDDDVIATDASWLASTRTGLSPGTPKRCWALGPIEAYDLRDAEPADWVAVGFDDGHWTAADCHQPTAPLSPSGLPPLRIEYVKPESLLLAEAVTTSPEPIGNSGQAYGAALESAERQPLTPGVRVEGDPCSGSLAIHGLQADTGIALHLDLGREYVGQVSLQCTADAQGTIDIGWAEYLDRDGRPKLLCKGVTYADRLEVPAGRACYRPSGFSAMRYVSVFLRGFSGTVELDDLGVIASEPDLRFTPPATFGDDPLTAIFRLCHTTNRIGTQEAIMDCPTREQATYIGDGHPVARWLMLISGDTRHWRRLVIDQFRRQAPNGLLRSTVYTGRDDALIDYSLIGVLGTRDYLRCTADVEAVRPLVPACRRVLGYFEGRLDACGLFCEDWRSMGLDDAPWENVYDRSLPRLTRYSLFIDHPGMGWHNVGQPGIDRRGTNAAINALLCLAHMAMAELEQRVGDAGRVERHKQRIAQLTAAGREAFIDDSRLCFIDGVMDGRRLTQVSQQTNTWAMLAGWGDCRPDLVNSIITRVLLAPGAEMASSGPYFWLYGLPVLAAHGRHREALDLIRSLWGPMVAGGATTLWETFDGGELDSWCHPWSAAPLPFLLNDILGLPAEHHCDGPVCLAPRCDLLTSASGRVITSRGSVEIQWSGQTLSGHLPRHAIGTLRLPDGRPAITVTGDWEVAL